MNTAALLCSVVLFVHPSYAQDGQIKITPAMQRYRDYRIQNTEPPFGLTKVKRLIAKIKPVGKPDSDTEIAATSAWNRLTTPEKFTYCMLHGEVYSQNCDAMPWIVDEEHKVFGQISSPFGDMFWSDRQRAFLKNHRSEVIRLLRTTIREKRRVGVNLKDTINDLGAYELIPDLVSAYNRDHRDQDILTVLFLLMKDGKYKPFLSSITYRKLYGPDSNYQSFIVANEANQKLSIDRAMAYYRTRVK
jgi:hypothetical protein